MLPALRTLLEKAGARFGWYHGCDQDGDVWRRVYRGDEIDTVLAEQDTDADQQAPDHAALAVLTNLTPGHVQPGVLDVRDRVLDDVLYLAGVLAAARTRRLPGDLITSLEAAVAHGRKLSGLLADTARATTTASSPS
ncbi:hypothetical protein ACIPSE_45420 [Streptomyces sp. NPDC090106]|uniref:hypothetical protein n=1 Tax=Streptomyces sp. NPDC090106 TaxID=3365946 RepID=UPI0037FABC26